jgi:MFS family permease
MTTTMDRPINPAVRRLAISQGLSLAARGAATTALIWVVYESTHSSWWVSVAMLAIFGISTAVSPWTGHVGDRHDRRMVVIVSAALAGAAFFASAVLVGVGLVDLVVAMMVAAAATQGSLGAAVQGAVPNLVAEDDLGRANSTIGVFKSAGYMLGPGVGGMLLAVISPADVFVISGLIMVAASALMWDVEDELQSHNRDESVGGKLDGYRQLMADRYMRRLTVAWALVMIGIGPVIVAEVTLATDFHVGSLGYGLISVAWDGGGIVGAVLAGRYVARRYESSAVIVGSVAIALGFIVVGVTPVFWPVLAGMMIAGVFDSLGTVAAQNITQRRTPNILQSRVSAALDAVVLGAMAASFGLGAPLIELFGAQGTYLVAAGITLVGALILLPTMRAMPEMVSVAHRAPARRANAAYEREPIERRPKKATPGRLKPAARRPLRRRPRDR